MVSDAVYNEMRQYEKDADLRRNKADNIAFWVTWITGTASWIIGLFINNLYLEVFGWGVLCCGLVFMSVSIVWVTNETRILLDRIGTIKKEINRRQK